MMHRSHFHAAPLLILGLCFTVAGNNAESVDVKDISGLAFHILRETTLDETTNFIMSPASIYSVLTVLLNGAGGNSAAEIKSLLGSDPLAVQNEYLTVLETSKGVRGEKFINSTSRIFYKKGIEINDAFRESAEKNFSTGFSEIDPTVKNAGAAISDWLRNTTNITIDGDDLAADSDMIIINAIQFQGGWYEKFDSQDTSDEAFYQSPNNFINAQFLVKKDARLVSGKNEDLGAKWIHIPYGKEFKMVLILPLKRFGLDDLMNKMSVDDLVAIMKADAVNTSSIVIPKFDVDYNFAVDIPLKKLGVNEIFTTHANLTGISKSSAPLKVDRIVQSCRIRVDEDGTAATTKTIGRLDFHRGSLGFPDDAFFVANEPFVFFILAREIPVFTGVIVYPKDNVN